MYSRNEVISFMHQDTASAFEKVADHLETNKDRFTVDDIISFLREISSEKYAAAQVVNLRDELKIPPTPLTP